MAATAVTPDDLDWLVAVLRRRREALVPHAPVFWRPAPDADARHRAYLHHLLTEGGARAWRTSTSALVAARRGGGWLVDDVHVEGASDAVDLWNAFASSCGGDDVRFVAPAYERERAARAVAAGLSVAETWWLLELASGGGEPGASVELAGADAVTVAAPPVYAPPGPMLFVSAVTDGVALAAAVGQAPALGCAGVVVNQKVGDAFGPALAGLGFRRHCDFFEGVIRPV
ncbi:hypothetical protein EUA06_08930 [Nocardioides glacieisoli]|uniref:N-acetyltransferase n=1 Tax=Nocardioides glacieisoli TaxID=1168730 RepID=A0A4Q2RUD8_9ACTN|nr:hypothetical protein [Nocardioides glacieisoli]RYB91439.1 hypothetical protein EUA06_08930 [Nocardioides glacieisoli]